MCPPFELGHYTPIKGGCIKHKKIFCGEKLCLQEHQLHYLLRLFDVQKSIYMKVKNEKLFKVFSVSAELLIFLYSRNKIGNGFGF